MRYPLRRACLIFGRSGGRRIPPNIFPPKIFFYYLYLWAHLHNLIQQNNNFSILKKIENPLLNPLINRHKAIKSYPELLEIMLLKLLTEARCVMLLF